MARGGGTGSRTNKKKKTDVSSFLENMWIGQKHCGSTWFLPIHQLDNLWISLNIGNSTIRVALTFFWKTWQITFYKKKQVGAQNGTSETAGRPLKAAQANGGGDVDQVLPVPLEVFTANANLFCRWSNIRTTSRPAGNRRRRLHLLLLWKKTPRRRRRSLWVSPIISSFIFYPRLWRHSLSRI